MYRYEIGIPMIDREFGGLRAASNVLILAPPLTYAEHLAYRMACPRAGNGRSPSRRTSVQPKSSVRSGNRARRGTR